MYRVDYVWPDGTEDCITGGDDVVRNLARAKVARGARISAQGWTDSNCRIVTNGSLVLNGSAGPGTPLRLPRMVFNNPMADVNDRKDGSVLGVLPNTVASTDRFPVDSSGNSFKDTIASTMARVETMSAGQRAAFEQALVGFLTTYDYTKVAEVDSAGAGHGEFGPVGKSVNENQRFPRPLPKSQGPGEPLKLPKMF